MIKMNLLSEAINSGKPFYRDHVFYDLYAIDIYPAYSDEMIDDEKIDYLLETIRTYRLEKSEIVNRLLKCIANEFSSFRDISIGEVTEEEKEQYLREEVIIWEYKNATKEV